YNNTTSQNISDSFTDNNSDDNDNSTNESLMLDSANSKEPILQNIADIKTR
ncbi:16471_t:CDS:1, partial [Funneliformis mosseae]